MISKGWKPHPTSYVNLLAFTKENTAHYITLIDRIFCLEIHVTREKNCYESTIYDEIRHILMKDALVEVSKKLKFPNNLCYRFYCQSKSCPLNEKHISYQIEGKVECCKCEKNFVTDLTYSHTVLLKKVCSYCVCKYNICTYVTNIHV